MLRESEFEVEDILRYRRNEDGGEYFLVKWFGYPTDQATWEPLEHMNDNCRELIAKARALFAWRRPAAAGASDAPAAVPARQQPEIAEVLVEAQHSPSDDGLAVAPILQEELAGGEDNDNDVLVEDGGEEPACADTAPDSYSFKRGAAGQAPDTAVGSVPPKRPRLQLAPQPSPPSAPPPAPASPLRVAEEPPLPPKPREVKCICGLTEKIIGSVSRGAFAVCKVCNSALHTTCVEGALGSSVPDNFVCPPCRLERVDEFHPPVGAGVLQHNYASCSSTLSLQFSSQVAQWRKQQWAVHLRAVQLNCPDLGGPAWPHCVQGKLNGRQCVAIDPPKHLHVRREQCYNLTPLLRPGVNNLELRFTPKPDKPRDAGEDAYCVGVVLTRPRSVASVIARIRTRSMETVSSGRSRVERLLKQVAEHEAGQGDECKVTGNFGRALKPLCPVSHCPIEEAAIGRQCNHVQVFDLQAYVVVNQRMRSLDKRWTCPVCSLALRPDDVILDPFAQGILDTLQGDEESVEAVVFNEDCTWSAVSAVKEDKDRNGNEDEGIENGGQAAELIDLSDSE